MGLWRQLTGGLRVLGNQERNDRAIAEELEHFYAEATAAHVARGLAPDEARRAARLELGNPVSNREAVRTSGWESAVEETLADLRIAVRRLRSSPGFTLLAALTLALGLGATTAIWSVVSPVLVRALPYPQASELVTIAERGDDGAHVDGTFGAFRALAERSPLFAALAVARPWQPSLIGDGEPESLVGQRVSADYFAVLGVRPALGEGFAAADDRPLAPRKVLLSDRLWRRRFAADPAVLGRTVLLDGGPCTVVGVLPASFENVLAPDAALWTPLQYDMTLPQAWGHHLRIVGRLRPDLGVPAARAELAAFSNALRAEHPREIAGGGLSIEGLQADVTRGVRPALLAVLGAALLVLLIACVNVTHLLLGRAVARRGELALRAALGAGRRRLLRQLLTESLLLSALGGVAGLGVAAVGLRALLALRPPGLPRVGAIALDARVFLFGFGVAVLVGLACGLLPALAAAGESPAAALGGGSRRTVGEHGRSRRALVVAEVAFALMLLVGSGLLLRSLSRLFAVQPGFAADGVLTLQLPARGARFADDAARQQLFERALAAVRDLPGVESAGLTSQLPLSGDEDVYGVRFESPASPESAEDQGAFRYAVSSGYLETLRIPLRSGRTFDAGDRAATTPVALLGESFARRRFPGVDPLGQRLQMGPRDSPWYTVVGVVADVKQMSLAARATDAVYVPSGQWPFADQTMSLVVRTRGDALALLPAVRAAIHGVDPHQPLARVATMDALLAASSAERRFALALFEAFALVALILAAIGVYGVLAGSVAERRRELAVRAALGAPRAGLLGMVMGQGLSATAWGAALGLVGATVGSRVLAALLFDVSPVDPATYAATGAMVLAVSALACLAPAWRAARVDPAAALRAD